MPVFVRADDAQDDHSNRVTAPSTSSDDAWVSMAEALRITGRGYRVMRRAVNDGLIPSITVGNRVFIARRFLQTLDRHVL